MKSFTLREAEYLLERGGFEEEALAETVRNIIADVRSNGDAALARYAEKFDQTILDHVAVTEEEFANAYREADPSVVESIRLAAKNILAYHRRALKRDDVEEDELGRKTGFVVRPVSRAGIYVPGGTAPLFSSVCMGILPAKAAGVKEIYVATPAKEGKINPLTLVAAKECGATKVFRIGGAQAIAAFAYGTESVPKVDVIAGPGNIFVTLAKKQVYGTVGIDMLAGPSEILIIADKSANPKYVAADMLSQAEHDKRARSIVLTDSKELASALEAEVESQLSALPREEIARYAVENNGGVVLLKDLAEAVEFSNRVAPEHLEIYTENAEELLEGITNAGAVFLGGNTPESVGDYFAGPDHILPTGGTARFFSVLNADVFMRKMSVIRYSREAILADGAHIVRLAESDGLDAHANAGKVRLEREA
ncbi:MAG: histidinol dehydrogenase [Christensenellaceae bacterium]